MISRLLSASGRLALQRPGLVLASMLVPALCSLYAIRVPLDFSFAGVMNREHPEVARYFAASERYGLGGLLPVLVEGREQSLDEAVLELRLALDDLDVVRSVAPDPPREWLLARAPYLVDTPTFGRWLALADRFVAGQAASEHDIAELRSSLERLERRHLPVPPEGSRLVVVSMASDSFELALDSDHFPVIRDAARRALDPFGARARFAGMPAIISQDQEATLSRMRVLAPVSLIGVLLLLRLMERRPLMLLSVALPMLLSVGMTLGSIGAIAGDLSLMEAVFGVLVFGLGIDFAIHLMLRLREERSYGRDFPDSLQRALAGTGRGIVAGGVTTGGAFLALALSPDPVFYRLGLAGGIGLLLCLLLLVLLLPAEWALIERWSSKPEAAPGRFVVPGLGSLAGLAIRRPLVTVLAAILVSMVCAAGLSKVRYETNLERVFSREIDAVDTARLIHDRFGVDPGPWLVAVDDLDEARRITQAFESSPQFVRAESLAYLFPTDLDERRAKLEAVAPALAERVREQERAARQAEGEEAGRARDEREWMTALLRAQAFGPPERGALPASLRERLLGPDGELIVYGFVAEPALDSVIAARERRVAQAIHPGATSMNVVYEVLIGTDRPWAPSVVSAVVIFILLVLYLDLRSKRLVLLTLMPVLAGSIVTLGLLGHAGFEFNTVTLVAVPLLLGLGIDDGIHIVHRMLEQPDAPLADTLDSVGGAIAMTTITTCASVGTLLFTRHPGIESMAILLLVGLPLCLLASVLLLPACAVLMGAPTVAEARASGVV